MNSTFKPDTAGEDLRNSLLTLMNKIKETQIIPEYFQYANITSLYKNKGERSDLNNDRGIFGLVKLRQILDKLIMNDSYDRIDAKMSDSNCGARKNRGVRDHLFVVHGVINDSVNDKGEPVAVQIYDVKKMLRHDVVQESYE